MKILMIIALFPFVMFSPSQVIAGAAQATRIYSEDGASGPGLFDAIHRVMPISVTLAAHPEYVDMATLGYRKFEGNLVIQNPKSRFSVFMWQEDAQGNRMGILDSGTTEIPGPWRKSVGDRFWAGKWSTDISAFSWSPNGEEMIIENGDVFNSGGVYWLDLMSKEEKNLGAGGMGNIDWCKRQVSVGKHTFEIPSAKGRGTFSAN